MTLADLADFGRDYDQNYEPSTDTDFNSVATIPAVALARKGINMQSNAIYFLYTNIEFSLPYRSRTKSKVRSGSLTAQLVIARNVSLVLSAILIGITTLGMLLLFSNISTADAATMPRNFALVVVSALLAVGALYMSSKLQSYTKSSNI